MPKGKDVEPFFPRPESPDLGKFRIPDVPIQDIIGGSRKKIKESAPAKFKNRGAPNGTSRPSSTRPAPLLNVEETKESLLPLSSHQRGTRNGTSRAAYGPLHTLQSEETKKIERITSAVIPSLSVLYIAACLAAILPRLGLMPGVLRLIVTSAFSPRAAGGAALGFSAREALRFGVMRGIFSNEAGCGTSPTAHASADTPSASRQASLGTAEVVFDTLILCSLTAFVLLLADAEAGLLPRHVEADAAPVVFEAFRILAG